MLSICFTCGLFDWMPEVIVAAIYTIIMSVYSGCFNFCNGSCASLGIIDVSRDQIVQDITEINGTVQKIVERIEIMRTNVKEPSAVNVLKWLNKFLKCRDDAITSFNALKHGGRLQIRGSDYLWRIWRRLGGWGLFSDTDFAFCWWMGAVRTLCQFPVHVCQQNLSDLSLNALDNACKQSNMTGAFWDQKLTKSAKAKVDEQSAREYHQLRKHKVY